MPLIKLVSARRLPNPLPPRNGFPGEPWQAEILEALFSLSKEVAKALSRTVKMKNGLFDVVPIPRKEASWVPDTLKPIGYKFKKIKMDEIELPAGYRPDPDTTDRNGMIPAILLLKNDKGLALVSSVNYKREGKVGYIQFVN